MPMVENENAATAAATQFRPKVLAFTCRWCTYAGADLAGLNRMKYPADIRLLRVPCSGRVNPQYVLEALQRGADGVLVCGCHPGDCHYATGNYFAKRRLMIFKRELEYIGLEPDRFQVRWISGAEAGKFRDTATAFCERIRELGPIGGDFKLEASLMDELKAGASASADAADEGSLATASPAASPARDDGARHRRAGSAEAVGASSKDPSQNASRSDAPSSGLKPEGGEA